MVKIAVVTDNQELSDNYKIEPSNLIKIIEIVYLFINSKSNKNSQTRLFHILFQLDTIHYEKTKIYSNVILYKYTRHTDAHPYSMKKKEKSTSHQKSSTKYSNPIEN